MKVLTILTNGFEEIEALGTIAILRRGNVDIDIYSLHENEATGRYDMTIKNLHELSTLKLNDYDFLFIPGGPQYKELENNPIFLEIVKQFCREDKFIAAICAGPTILGHLGLLKDRNYTCFKSMNENFGGHYIEDYVVQDGKLITAISAAATIEFAFKILENIKGKDKAELVKDQIYYYSKK